MRFSRWLSAALVLVGLVLGSGGARALTPDQEALYRAIGPYVWSNALADYIGAKVSASGINCNPNASLETCVALLPSTGGKIILPADTTIVRTTTLTITKPNVTVECPSWNTIIQRGPSLGLQVINMTGAGDVIRNCTIDGNGASNTSGAFDLVISGANSLIDHVRAIAAGGQGAIEASGTNSRVTASTVTGLGTSANVYGIWAINHVPVEIDHNVITATGIDGVGYDGTGSSVHDNFFSNNHCYTGTAGGAIVSYPGAINTSISNNVITTTCAANSFGIEDAGINTAIIGNIINKANGTAIVIDSGAGTGHLISGNTVLASGQQTSAPGFATQAAVTNLTIVGNRFGDDQGSPTQTYGISLGAFAYNNLTVVGNNLVGNLTGAFNNGSTGSNQLVAYNNGSGLGPQYQNLYTTGTSVGNGADTTEDTLQSFTVPANTLNNVGDKLHVIAGGAFTSDASNKTARLRFGGAQISNPVGTATGQIAWRIDAWFVKTAANTYTVSVGGTVLNQASNGTAAAAAQSLTLTSNQAMIITGQNSTVGTANTITCSYFQVELVQAP